MVGHLWTANDGVAGKEADCLEYGASLINVCLYIQHHQRRDVAT